MFPDGVAAAIGADIERELRSEVGGVGGRLCAHTAEPTARHAAASHCGLPPARASLRLRFIV
jgi:hypothetical protein